MSNLEDKEREIVAKIAQKEHADEILKYAIVEYKASIQALKSRIAELESTFNGDKSHDAKIQSDIAVLEQKLEAKLNLATTNEQSRLKIASDIHQLQGELARIQQEMRAQPAGA